MCPDQLQGVVSLRMRITVQSTHADELQRHGPFARSKQMHYIGARCHANTRLRSARCGSQGQESCNYKCVQFWHLHCSEASTSFSNANNEIQASL